MLRFALHVLFFLSGAAALGYQLVWSKMFSTGLGHEYPAVLAIVCAFMAGMALGAAVIDRFVPRDARAGRWLAGLELLIGGWAVLAGFLIPHVNEWALGWIGLEPSAAKHWLIAFVVPALALLPATMAMGATLPVMEKFLSAIAPNDSSVGSVYAANTFGAVVGTLIAPFVLMPALGLRQSCWMFAGLNLMAGVGALIFSQRFSGFTHASESVRENVSHASLSFGRLSLALFITGLLGISFETASVRVLSQVLENTVFSYAAVLAIFLLGTAAGAGAFHRWGRKIDAQGLLVNLLLITTASCLFGVGVLGESEAIYDFFRRLGDSTVAVLAAELLTAGTVLAAPTFFMGATFSHLVQQARAAHGDIGKVVALNTMGAALAPLLVVMLLPMVGAKWLLTVVAIGYALLTIPPPLPKLGFLYFFPAVITFFSDLRLVDLPPDGHVTQFREGVMGTVAVVEESGGHRTLRVDNRFQMGGTAAADAEYRQAHLPLLLHESPRRALFLGLGTGISFGAASLYPELKADGVELVPEVVDVMPQFARANFSPAQQQNLKLHVADARRFVRATSDTYDVIVADVFHPYRDGAGALYSREHFAAIRNRLGTNGIFCQWLPLYQLDGGTLRIIVATFLTEFPHADAWLLRFNVDVPVVALVGSREASIRRTNLIESRLSEPRLAGELKRLALTDSLRLHGHWLAGREVLLTFAGRSVVNTDDNQRVTFTAPRHAYQRDIKPYASLEALLEISDSSIRSVRELTEWARQDPFVERLKSYLTARNMYLRGLIHDREGRRDKAVDAYIESARTSSEFTTGYAQCLSIANALANSDPATARSILERIIEAQPSRPVAREMLKRLFRE